MKTILSILILFLVSCSDNNTPTFKTGSVIQKDISSSVDKDRLFSKTSSYLEQSYKLGSSHYDEHGLLLPTQDGQFKDQGDALLWNSISLASMCLIHSKFLTGKLDSRFNLESEIVFLWNSLKKLQLSSGALIRHPIVLEGRYKTSISKDQITGFLLLGAIAKDTECSPIVFEYKSILQKFSSFIVSNNFEMGIGEWKEPSTTLLTDRHFLGVVHNLYRIKNPNLLLDLSLHNIKFSAQSADWLYTNRYFCLIGSPLCNEDLNVSSFIHHLTFLGVLILNIEARHRSDSLYDVAETERLLGDMARVGQSTGITNMLFLAGWRYSKELESRDVQQYLIDNFPDSLPNEKEGVKGYGCSDYIFQRSPVQKCNDSNKEFIGADFLFAFGLSI